MAISGLHVQRVGVLPLAVLLCAITNVVCAQDHVLTNLSCRGLVGRGSESFIAGFAIREEHRILLRAVGPGLSSFGVTNYCRDPRVVLYQGEIAIATNEGWPSDTATRAAISEAGAFSLLPGSKDSVLLMKLKGGDYTALILSQTGESGIALFEIYDLDASATGLVNISVRAITAPGDAALTTGLVVRTGVGRTELMWRVIGPGLESFGISGVLRDPKLTIRAQNSPTAWQTIVDGKVGWSGSNSSFTRFGAFPLSIGSADAVYTAFFQNSRSGAPNMVLTASTESVTGSSGVVLFELYQIPSVAF